MVQQFSYTQFLKQFSTDDACLEEFRKLRYPNGIFCTLCKEKTKHYKLTGRTAYACKNCRHQVFPLTGTILEKTSTPLQVWFYAMFLMTHTRANITIKQLQRETGVTYKTAWRMYTRIKVCMSQNNGDLLRDTSELVQAARQQSVHKWTFLKAFEITVTQKEESGD